MCVCQTKSTSYGGERNPRRARAQRHEALVARNRSLEELVVVVRRARDLPQEVGVAADRRGERVLRVPRLGVGRARRSRRVGRARVGRPVAKPMPRAGARNAPSAAHAFAYSIGWSRWTCQIHATSSGGARVTTTVRSRLRGPPRTANHAPYARTAARRRTLSVYSDFRRAPTRTAPRAGRDVLANLGNSDRGLHSPEGGSAQRAQGRSEDESEWGSWSRRQWVPT